VRAEVQALREAGVSVLPYLRSSDAALRHRCYRGSLPQTALMVTALAVHRGTWLGVDRFIALSPVVDYLRDVSALRA
jgi:hypothetical protein